MNPKSNDHPNSHSHLINPGEFEVENHYYPKVLNAHIHPLVGYFMRLTNKQIRERYCYLHPEVNHKALDMVLNYQPRYFRWAGCDLFPVSTSEGHRQMVIIETNSCPSGMKSLPLINEGEEQGSYKKLLERTFIPHMLSRKDLPKGKLAVVYDKNEMEASGYACVLADLMNEPVYLTKFDQSDSDPPIKFQSDLLYVRDQKGKWIPIRAAFRYVTQKPWNRIPIITQSHITNPIIACLAGGRNKMVAAKAYDMFTAELRGTGLSIRVPETIWDLKKNEIPLWIHRMNGFAVIKSPYLNAGQGIWTITNQKELKEFMEQEHPYNKFIVQSMIGHSKWLKSATVNRYFHVGTVPNRHNHIFAADMRFMVSAGAEDGFRTLSIYSRRAKSPLEEKLDPQESSWDVLGTNLSFKNPDGKWDTDTNRLLLMDRRDFNKLGLGLDDLTEAFIQTVLAINAIDRMAIKLISSKKRFKKKLYRSLNPDKILLDEILPSL